MEQRTTGELMDILKTVDSPSGLKEFDLHADFASGYGSFADFINEKLKLSGITPGEAIRRANIQRNYGYQILSGKKNPGHDKAVSLCLTLRLSFDDTQRALNLSKSGTLYPKRRRDSILIYSINNSLSVQETNDLLYEMGEKPLK